MSHFLASRSGRSVYRSSSALSPYGRSPEGRLVAYVPKGTQRSSHLESNLHTQRSTDSGWNPTLPATFKPGVLWLLILAMAFPQAAFALSTQVDVTFTIAPSTGNVRLRGDAFPGALVTIRKDRAVIATTTANSHSAFEKTITGLPPGMAAFSLYANDSRGSKTATTSFSVDVIKGSTVQVSGIFLSPTLLLPERIKRPERLTQSGFTKQGSTVTTFTLSEPISKITTADKNGAWSLTLSEVLHLGTHTVTALAQDENGALSAQTNPVEFIVERSADLNVDHAVDMADFSILMENYSEHPPANLTADINDDGPVDLTDFSMMMYEWTGRI